MLTRLVAWGNRSGPKWVSRAVKAGSFCFGVAILYHEAFQAKNVEPLLIFLGLWMCGVPPATFFDSVRKAGQHVEEALTEAASGIPEGEHDKHKEHTEDA